MGILGFILVMMYVKIILILASVKYETGEGSECFLETKKLLMSKNDDIVMMIIYLN